MAWLTDARKRTFNFSCFNCNREYIIAIETFTLWKKPLIAFCPGCGHPVNQEVSRDPREVMSQEDLDEEKKYG